jgi:hypothetical protein
MEKNKLEYILNELYQFYPELQEHENKLKVLVVEMLENKPDTKFDESFALKLKQRILSENVKIENKNNNFSINIMNKKILIVAGSLIAASFLFLVVINIYGPEKEDDSAWSLSSLINVKKEEAINHLPAGSFGSLVNISASLGDSSEESAFLGLKDSQVMVPTSSSIENDAIRTNYASSEGMAVGAGSTDMMIFPFYGFQYVYSGDEFTLDGASTVVYRRLKNQDDLAKDLAKTISSFDLSGLSLKPFNNLMVNSLSFSENKDQGLIINFDLKEGSVYIFENWQTWNFPEREDCGEDQACWDSFRLKIEDVPSDNNLIALTDKFLSDHKINLVHYGDPLVDNTWRNNYEIMENKDDFYIPEYISVIYPLLIEGAPVRNQSGDYIGLRLTVNLLYNKVSGLSGLSPYRYESSNYNLETSSEKIIAIAESGGWNYNYYSQNEESDLPIVELGTPKQAHVQLWKYDNNSNQELLVPSLIFPITKKPEQGYYGGNYVVVPLVKELIEELDRNRLRNNIELPMPIKDRDIIMETPSSEGDANESEVIVMPTY